MRPAAHLQAAIDVLDDMQRRHRPASVALGDWGKSHRFAGSGDRAAIGNLVYDCLRRRASADHVMQAQTARARLLGTVRIAYEKSVDDIAALCDGDKFSPARLTADERARLAAPLTTPTDHTAAEMPKWAFDLFENQFGGAAIAEGQALATRAPVDLRVNTLKSDRAALAIALARHKPSATPLSMLGLRIPMAADQLRHPNVEAELTHGQGHFEVQDEGSQIAAALAGVAPGESVLDLCAGGGGKTLALAAALANRGRLVAYDDDKLRLRPIVERLQRAGATCVTPIDAGDTAALAALGATFDCVLVDAPCTGSGTWRRKPDAKWRLKPASLDQRCIEQRAVLDAAAQHVKPGGRLVYITCSLFEAENANQVTAFMDGNPDYRIVPTAEAWTRATRGALDGTPPASADGRTDTLTLTPSRHGTDGFFVAVLERRA